MSEQICFPDGDPETADWFVLGSAPWKDERREKRGMAGAAGRMFWKEAAHAKLTRDRCFVSNVIQEWPELKKGEPSVRQVRANWGTVDAELAAFRGSILVPVGGAALARVTGLTSITRFRGYCIRPQDCVAVMQRRRVADGTYKTSGKCPECKGTGETGLLTDYGTMPSGECLRCKGSGYTRRAGDPRYKWVKVAEPARLPPNVKWIVPVLTPKSVALSGFTMLPAFAADVRRAGRLAHDDSTVITEPVVTDHRRPPLSLGPIRVTIDIETPGKTPITSGAIDRVGVAFDDAAGEAVCWSEPWTAEIRDEVARLTSDPTIENAYHNRGFDDPRMAAGGAPTVGDTLDTMWAAQILRPDLRKGLERVAPLYLDVILWKHLNEADPRFYNLMDAYVQHRLAKPMMARLAATHQLEVCWRFMRALPVMMGMHARGIYVDPEAARVWAAEEEAKLTDAALEWPWPDVNFNSSKQLADLFYGRLKLPMQFSKHGDPTCDEIALKTLRRLTEDPEVLQGIDALLRARRHGRNVSYYSDVALGEDGCVHPDYVPEDKDQAKGGGSKTGRIQPRNPNIANQTPESRKLYRPRPGCRFVGCDWQNAEPYIEAAIWKDDALWAALQDGIYERVMGIMETDDRPFGKEVWLATGRLAAASTISRRARRKGIDKSTDDCKRAQQKIYQAFPNWAAGRLATIAEAEARKPRYVEEPLGRRYYYFGSGRGPMIVGYKPQAGVGSMLQEVMPDIDALCESLGGCFTLSMHDEALTEVPDGRERDMEEGLREIMTREWPQVAPGFRLKVDVEVGEPGESWGAMNERYKA